MASRNGPGQLTVAEFHTQYGNRKNQGDGIGQNDGPFAQQYAIDQPAKHTKGKEGIHAQREGFRIACAKGFNCLRNKRKSGGNGCRITEY